MKEDSIIPICLVNNKIVLPIRKIVNNKPVLECQDGKTFYAINPDISPKPIGLDLICISKGKLSIKYDPFDLSEKCLSFYAWLERAPYTVPLYLYSGTDGLVISETKTDLTPYIPDVIHLLTSPNLFVNSKGRCVPNGSTGITLEQCIVLHNKNILQPEKNIEPTIIKYLENRYGKKRNNRNVFLFIGLVVVFVSALFAILELKKRRKK